MPSAVKVPNAATRRAMAGLEQSTGKRFASADALFDDLDIQGASPPLGAGSDTFLRASTPG